MPEGGFPTPRGGRFATTRWSLVVAAGRRTDARSAEALASVCEMYWFPVYAFIRRQGYHADEGADLTQEFFARVLEKGYLTDADPERGRFRGFLCASIRHSFEQRDRAGR
jgi:RNA polymerase sigma-70 factor (ECF subfamily)